MRLAVGLLSVVVAMASVLSSAHPICCTVNKVRKLPSTPAVTLASLQGGRILRPDRRSHRHMPWSAPYAPRGMLSRRAMASIPSPLGLLKAFGKAYSNWMMEQPIRANLISGILMVAVGDGISQAIEVDAKTGQKKCTSWRDLSLRRLANAGFAGAVFNGVLLPQWYLLLHKLSPGAETPKTIAAKILGNCVAWGCVGNAAIMAMRRVLDGESWHDAEQAVRRDLWGVMMNDYKIWPLYDVLCFTCIPRHLHGLSTGTLGIVWATYLSYVTHTEGH
ncbi:mpv17-like protein [Nannochloropsis gaditana]|uniref:Mpv17-like protein n=2 Tax=Monodopsidaceae TaxID=425072 RepID=W7U6G1_9STRA|nr:mpv17-like protein [Nannochloropsis gaditana]